MTEFIKDIYDNEDEIQDVRETEPSEPRRDDDVPDIHQYLTETKDYPDEPGLTIYDGVPRFAHKTTSAVQDAAELDCKKVIICKNHTLATETIHDKLTQGKYAIGTNSVVHLKGKKKSKGCECTNDYPTGKEYYKLDQIVKENLHKHEGGIKPRVFDGTDACPYHATKRACHYQEWIVTVPQMWPQVKNEIESEHAVIVDEEDTMAHYFPKSGNILKLSIPNDNWSDDWDIGYQPTDMGFDESGIDFIRTTVQNKIDEMDRIPGRYTAILDAVDAYEELRDQVIETTNYARGFDENDAVMEAYHNVDVPSVDLPESTQERRELFRYLRKALSYCQTADMIEAMFCNPRLVAQKSGESINVRLVPDPLHDFMIHRDLFTEAEHVWFIGNRMAKYTAAHFHSDPDEAYNLLDAKIPQQMLDILTISGEEEMQRRAQITQIASKVTDEEIHNFMIAGSSRRASNVSNAIGARSYYFKGQATLNEYSDMAKINWNVCSYMGSRLTRGIDVESQVTMIRSKYFATPRWDYYRPGETLEIENAEYRVDKSCSKMQDYENIIEVHNGMLRGAGQGEKHVSIIPSNVDLFWGLDEYTTDFNMHDVEDVVKYILDALEIVPLSNKCDDCGSKFFIAKRYREHICDTSHTIGRR